MCTDKSRKPDPLPQKKKSGSFFCRSGSVSETIYNPTSESKFMDNWNFNKHKQEITLTSLFPRLSRLSGESLGTRLDTYLNGPP